MGSYLVGLQSAFVLSAFSISRLPWRSRKASAAAFALLKPRKPNRWTNALGLIAFASDSARTRRSIELPKVAVPVEHKRRLIEN